MTNEDFIREHREEDVRQLALRGKPEGVDVLWCLQQIEGWQLARRKLPSWASTEGIWYGPRLSMEQCSSEETARYKRDVAARLIPQRERLRMADLTGGLGVDFSFLATLFHEASYVEVQPELCRLARHNLPLLLDGHGTTYRVECGEWTAQREESPLSLAFLDPARRDGAGRKTVSIQDCMPNLLELQEDLLRHSKYTMTKLSPMLDITEALRLLRGVCEVHVVSVRGECKELLLVMKSAWSRPTETEDEITIHCVNLGTDDEPLTADYPLSRSATGRTSDYVTSLTEDFVGIYLYEPNSSILKAGIQDILCKRYEVRKLHPHSNVFVSPAHIPHFPGRHFRITGFCDFSKKDLRQLTRDLGKANITLRNFPASVEALRRQLHLAEGGDVYLFATTQGDGKHVLIRCEHA